MRLMLSLLPLTWLVGCAAPDLSGTWDGDALCDGFPIPFSFTLTATEDDGEYDGDGETSFSDGSGEVFYMAFRLELEHGDATDDGMDLVVDVEDCMDREGNQYTCFDASMTWEEGDDEISGQVTDYPVQPGTCELQVER